MARYQDTYITIYRPDSTVLARHLPVQLVQMSTREVLLHQQVYGLRTAAIFRIVTGFNPQYPIQTKDLLVDELNVDPAAPAGTSGYYRYRVISNPVEEFDDHQEVVCEVVRGG